MFNKKQPYPAATAPSPAAVHSEPDTFSRIRQHVSHMPTSEIAIASIVGISALALIGYGISRRSKW